MDAIHQEFVMQVRACGCAGRAHRADDLALVNRLALFDLSFVQVQVASYILLPVLDKNIVTVRPAISCFDHAPVASSEYGGAPGGGIVGAAVGAGGFVYWMEPSQVEV